MKKKKKTKNSKFFLDIKQKKNEKNEKIGYAMSILLRNEENKLCPMKIGQSVQKL